MGCDYYIYTELEIETAEGLDHIQIRCERGFFFPNDSDDEKDTIAYVLKPSYKPKIVYADGTFFGLFDKYEPILKTHFGDKWASMLSRDMKIHKVEKRVSR
jgi:hypothetical protein